MKVYRSIFISIVTGMTVGLFAAKYLHKIISTFFYICFIAAIIAGLISGIFLWIQFKNHQFIHKDSILYWPIMFLASSLASISCFAFLATVPLNIDRSFSVWMLSQIDLAEKNGDSPTELELKKRATQYFNQNSPEIDRRINEQLKLGNIKFQNKHIQLTINGKMTVNINRKIRSFFDLDINYAG